jgi:hypothetical protein
LGSLCIAAAFADQLNFEAAVYGSAGGGLGRLGYGRRNLEGKNRFAFAIGVRGHPQPQWGACPKGFQIVLAQYGCDRQDSFGPYGLHVGSIDPEWVQCRHTVLKVNVVAGHCCAFLG